MFVTYKNLLAETWPALLGRELDDTRGISTWRRKVCCMNVWCSYLCLTAVGMVFRFVYVEWVTYHRSLLALQCSLLRRYVCCPQCSLLRWYVCCQLVHEKAGQMLILSTCSKVLFSDASIFLEVRLGKNESYVELETHFSVCWLAYWS